MVIRHAKRGIGLKKTEVWIILTVSTEGNCIYCSILIAKIKIIGGFLPSECIRVQPELATGFTFKNSGTGWHKITEKGRLVVALNCASPEIAKFGPNVHKVGWLH